MKQLFSLILFTLLIGFLIVGCNEVPNSSQPDELNSQPIYKGTETLGNPEEEPDPFYIASGTGFVEVGIGMNTPPPGQASGTGNLYVPGAVQQAIIYWAGGNYTTDPPSPPGDADIKVNGYDVTGTLIGGPATFGGNASDINFYSYRADITGLVKKRQNTFTITELAFTQQTDGVSIVVIYDDRTQPVDIQFRDGLDLAYHNSPSQADITEKQSFTFASSPTERTANLHLIVGSVKEDRPNTIEITVDGVTTSLENLLHSADGADWDSPVIPVTIPAGVTTLDVQLFSAPTNTGLNAASLAWITAALSIEEPPDNFACGRMTGGGSIFDNDDHSNPRVTHGFEIHCDLREPNNIEVNWPGGENFHLTELTYAECIDDPNIDQRPPQHAPFDTFIGKGYGKYNNIPGAYIEFTFIDAGEPGKNDSAEIKIWESDSKANLVLEVSGHLDRGNHQTHRDKGCGQ